ncbi:GRAS family protein [Archangium lipolyticum]|uniref:GRAS family protein n=1 Tax=Archangium lipolyticum TaxID=2970465 RepID=UPI002149C482|nr:GRAS family protein [Archangium lipolyticum]
MRILDDGQVGGCKEGDVRSEKFSLLTRALEELQEGQLSSARRSLGALTRLLDVEGVAEDMQYFLFATALARRVGIGDVRQMNLYLRRFELPQIALFNLLGERLPLVSLARDIANDWLCELLAGHEEATLFDVGLGTGRQEVALLRKLKATGAAPRRLTLVGLDPDGDSLAQAETVLTATARELGFELRFRSIPKVVEALGEGEWNALRDCPGPRVVHAAFALHHIAADADRQELFHRLRALEPAGVVLCEPNSDHFTDSLSQRFHNVWRHLFFVFSLVDELGLPRQERNGIKLFFGRELEDILGVVEDAQRYERHERTETWLGRLRGAGFFPEGRARGLEGTARHPALAIREAPGVVGLGYQEETIVSLLRAVPGTAA